MILTLMEYKFCFLSDYLEHFYVKAPMLLRRCEKREQFKNERHVTLNKGKRYHLKKVNQLLCTGLILIRGLVNSSLTGTDQLTGL